MERGERGDDGAGPEASPDRPTEGRLLPRREEDRGRQRPEDPDAADAARAADGDERAFERLYRRHVPRIHSLARRMIGPGEADAVTQRVFVRAWRKLDQFRGDAAFGTWLYQVAISVILSRRRTLGRRRDREAGPAALETMTGRRSRPDLAVDLEAAMERLPDGARQIFVLHDVEGYKHREIADMLDVTEGTSKSQLHRARTILREQLTA